MSGITVDQAKRALRLYEFEYSPDEDHWPPSRHGELRVLAFQRAVSEVLGIEAIKDEEE